MHQNHDQETTNNIFHRNTYKQNLNLIVNGTTEMELSTKPLYTKHSVSLENNLQLYPELNVVNSQSTNSKVTTGHVSGNKLILNLNDYLALFGNKHKLNVELENNLSKNITYNGKSAQYSNGLGADQPKLKNILVDKTSKNTLIPKEYSENEICSVPHNTKQPLKLITNKNIDYSIKTENFLVSKHMATEVITRTPFILKQMPYSKIHSKAKLDTCTIAKRNKVKRKKNNSLLEQENIEQLRTTFEKRNNTAIFPVALQRSGAQDFHSIKLLNICPPNESEMQILGI